MKFQVFTSDSIQFRRFSIEHFLFDEDNKETNIPNKNQQLFTLDHNGQHTHCICLKDVDFVWRERQTSSSNQI